MQENIEMRIEYARDEENHKHRAVRQIRLEIGTFFSDNEWVAGTYPVAF